MGVLQASKLVPDMDTVIGTGFGIAGKDPHVYALKSRF